MTILRARTAGFCMGVSLALQKLAAALEGHTEQPHAGASQPLPKASGRMVMLGPIIHNPDVLAEFTARGVFCAHGIDEIRAEDTVIIRAHGIPRGDEARLRALGVVIIDATCPKVKKAQLAIDAATCGARASLLLFGEEDHPEVRGLVSYANGSCVVFSDAVPHELPRVPLVLAAQTTQDRALFEHMADDLRRRRPEITVLSTICDATAKRQKETVDIARKVDMMLVIGGHESGNTRRLVDVARAQGVEALHVERMSDLPPDSVLSGYGRIGLTAGASTPHEHVDAIESHLQRLGLTASENRRQESDASKK